MCCYTDRHSDSLYLLMYSRHQLCLCTVPGGRLHRLSGAVAGNSDGKGRLHSDAKKQNVPVIPDI